MTTLRTIALLAAVILGTLLFVPDAYAATTCTISPSELNFGPVSDTGSGSASTTFTVQCHTEEVFSLAGQARVRLCLKIGNGNVGSNNSPRLMRHATTSDTLAFQIYSDPARSKMWTYSDVPPAAAELFVSYPLVSFLGLGATGDGSGTFTLYGGAGNQSLVAGDYSATFADTQLAYRSNLGNSDPSTCSGGNVTTTSFVARAQVPSLCTISAATDLDFGGNAGTIDANRDSTSAISLACRNRSVWNVGLDNGVNANGNLRRMRLIGTPATNNFVAYELYRDSGRSQRWGNTINADTYSGTSSSTTTLLTVYGRVPGSPIQTVPPGTYSDTVTVKVTY